MSSTTGAQNLLVNVFRPAYTYNSTTGLFTPSVDLANVAYSGNTIAAFTAAIGDSAGNVYVGSNAGNSYTDTRSCTNNVALGYYAGQLISNVTNSIYIGSNAGTGSSNASNVISIGTNAGGNGTSNIFVGTSTGSTGNSNILIGHGIAAGSSNNLLRIGRNIYGNTSNGWVGIGTDTATSGNNFDISGNAKVSGILSAGAFDVSAVAAINLVVPGYIRNQVTPTQFDISGGNISNSAVHTTTGLVGTYLRNALTPTQFDISGGNISNSGTHTTSNAIVSGYLRSSLPTDTFMVAVGSGTNSLAYSSNGTTWTGVGTSIFSGYGYDVAWNGSLWVAVGSGTANSFASSTDGINWTGRGFSVFDLAGAGVAWNGSLWVAVGTGTSDSIATSTDGITWVGRGNTIFDDGGLSVAWNGSLWVAVGSGTTNTIAYSTDGINWTGLGLSIFSTNGWAVAWNGSLWVAVGEGSNTIAYSTDGINWTGVGTSIFSGSGRGVAWNGSLWVAVGQGTNTIATSTDGINWTGRGATTFTTRADGVAWNGTVWVAGGTGTNSLAYSSNGTSWTGLGTTTFSSYANGAASRRHVLPLIDSTILDTSGGNIEYTGSIIGSNAGSSNRIGGVTLSNYNLSASNIQTGNGTVSRPAYAFTADTSLGIYRVGANQLGFASAGSNRMTISNSNVGIGTVEPQAALDVSSNAIIRGYLRNALTPTTWDISGGNISNSGTTTSSNFMSGFSSSNRIGGVTMSQAIISGAQEGYIDRVVGSVMRNSVNPFQFDISGGNISNSATTRSSNFIGTASASNSIGGITLSNGTTTTTSLVTNNMYAAGTSDVSAIAYIRMAAADALSANLQFLWLRSGGNPFRYAGINYGAFGNQNFMTYNAGGGKLVTKYVATTNPPTSQSQLDVCQSLFTITNTGSIGIGTDTPSYTLDVSAGTTTASINMTSWTRVPVGNTYVARGIVAYRTAVPQFSNALQDINSQLAVVTNDATNGTYFQIRRSGIWSIRMGAFYHSVQSSLSLLDVSTNFAYIAGAPPAAAPGTPLPTTMDYNQTNNFYTRIMYTGYLPSSSTLYYKVYNTNPTLTNNSNQTIFTLSFIAETPTGSANFPYTSYPA